MFPSEVVELLLHLSCWFEGVGLGKNVLIEECAVCCPDCPGKLFVLSHRPTPVFSYWVLANLFNIILYYCEGAALRE